MASKDYAIVDINNDDHEVDLQFQEFENTRTAHAEAKLSHQMDFEDFPDSDDQNDNLLDTDEESSQSKKSSSFWTFEFYQQFFDVDSKQVGDRIVWSMVPKPGVNYLQSYIRPNPDLYGPFWICLTLVFTTAITGNLSNYLQTPAKETYIWKYDFHKVTFAASSIFAYAWLIPLLLWGFLLWRASRAGLSLLELLCLYGYSLAIFVPVSILWMIPQPWLQWCLAIVAPVLSGTVLVRTLWPSLAHETKQVAIVVAIIVLLLHTILALGFMLYFFSPPDKSHSMVPLTQDKATTLHKDESEKAKEGNKERDIQMVNANAINGDDKKEEAKGGGEGGKNKEHTANKNETTKSVGIKVIDEHVISGKAKEIIINRVNDVNVKESKLLDANGDAVSETKDLQENNSNAKEILQNYGIKDTLNNKDSNIDNPITHNISSPNLSDSDDTESIPENTEIGAKSDNSEVDKSNSMS